MPKNPDFDRKFSAAMLKAMDDLVNDHAGQIRTRISTAYPPASSAGHPPHSRTGELLNNVKIDGPELLSGHRVEATIVSERPSTPEVPSILEDAFRLNRPYMVREVEEIMYGGAMELAMHLRQLGIACKADGE